MTIAAWTTSALRAAAPGAWRTDGASGGQDLWPWTRALRDAGRRMGFPPRTTRATRNLPRAQGASASVTVVTPCARGRTRVGASLRDGKPTAVSAVNTVLTLARQPCGVTGSRPVCDSGIHAEYLCGLMARRSPAEVRHEVLPLRRLGERAAVPSGVSAAGVAAIARLERERFSSGAIVHALRRLEELAKRGQFRSDPARCGDLECCGAPDELFPILETAVRVLSQRDARVLRGKLADLELRLYPYGRIL